jgi:hypothetical protein
VVSTVIQYFSKAVTYSEQYSICTVRYTIFSPQHSKKFAPCTFLLQNLFHVLFYRSWYVDTKLKVYDYFGKYSSTISEFLYKMYKAGHGEVVPLTIQHFGPWAVWSVTLRGTGG